VIQGGQGKDLGRLIAALKAKDDSRQSVIDEYRGSASTGVEAGEDPHHQEGRSGIGQGLNRGGENLAAIGLNIALGIELNEGDVAGGANGTEERQETEIGRIAIIAAFEERSPRLGIDAEDAGRKFTGIAGGADFDHDRVIDEIGGNEETVGGDDHAKTGLDDGGIALPGEGGIHRLGANDDFNDTFFGRGNLGVQLTGPYSEEQTQKE
jgi:hypothetical protein